MSALETNGGEAWQDAFIDTQNRTTPKPDDQPSWQLTALGVAIGFLALIVLSV